MHREEIEKLFGAKYVGEVPDVGGGAFGMARLAHILHQRLTPADGPGRPSNGEWEKRPKVPMSRKTHRKLKELARQLSSDQRRISPMQVAAQLLEQALADLEKKEQK